MKKLLIPFVIVFLATNSLAQTPKSGTIDGETWIPRESPYILVGNISIANLTIQPGVTIMADGDYEIKIDGIITAIGTKQDSVFFTKTDKAAGWRGMFFNATKFNSVLKYCVIAHATNSGIRSVNSTPTIENCTFTKNSGTQGGGMRIYNDTLLGSEFKLNDCAFIDNKSSSHGGALHVYLEQGKFILNNSLLKDNIANPLLAFGDYVGGALYFEKGDAVFSRSIFVGNRVNSVCEGPFDCGVTARAGAIYIGSSGNITIENSTFRENRSYAQGKTNCFFGGIANSYGGAIYVNSGKVTLSNNILSHNSTPRTNCGPSYGGGGLYVNGGTVSVINCTIAENSDATGVRCVGGTLNIMNSIIYFNNKISNEKYGTQIDGAGAITVTYSDVQDSLKGEGNIDENPIFRDVSTFQLSSISRCIDAGNPENSFSDVCFPPSLGISRNDMGAYGGPGACKWLTLEPPKNLKARAGDRQATLMWDANKESNFLRYRIYRDTSPNPNVKTDSVEGVGNTTKTITGLTNGTTYFFRISAVNSVFQESGFSNEVSATPPANRPPVVLNSISNQTITLGVSSFIRNLNASPPIFSDPEGQTLNYTASSSATNIATPSISGSTLTVTPIAAGSATITVTSNDGDGGTSSTMFVITVNRRPIVANAIPDLILQFGGASFTRDLKASPAVFSDPDNGDILAYATNSSDTTKAKARLIGSVLTVNSVAGGSANIIVTANDSRGGTIADTFKVTVNRPPMGANPIADQNLTLGGAAFTRNLNTSPAVFTDPDGDAFIYISSSSDTNRAKARISGTTLTVTPVDTGSATITITADDSKGGTASTTFTARVRPGNRQPTVANPIPNQTLAIGGAAFVRNLNSAPVVFSDPDGDALTYTTSSSVPAVATASITSGSTLTVTQVALGNTTITVTANDGRNGSVSPTFAVMVNQSSVPQITHSPILLAPSGQSQPISATLIDNNGIQSALLYYRIGGTLTYVPPIPMPKLSGDVYQGIIPAGVVTERGFEYYFSVENTVGNKTTFPATNPDGKPQLVQVNNSNFVFSTPTLAKVYRMISIPFDLNDKSPASVLGDDFGGTYDDKQWRLLKYLNGANLEFGNPNFSNFEPGTGFWLITREAKILDAGAGRSVTTAQNYIIILPRGWSQIGNPFAFTVNWSEIIKGANVEDKLVGYQGSSNDSTGYDFTRTQLIPFEGYFVNNRGSSPTTIEIPPKAAPGSAAAKPLADWKSALQSNEWALQITAESGRYLDKDNYLGAFNDASDEWDPNDFSEAPFFDQHVALYFPHSEWKKYPDLYTGDFRVVKPEGDYWDFVVKSEVAKSEVVRSEVVLKLAEAQNLPADWEIVLLDKASRVAIDFSEKKQYSFPSGNGKTVREFRIVVGKKDFVETNDLNLSGVPQAFALGQNYPNPFNPSTVISFQLPVTSNVKLSIYNLNGQLVRTLFEGEQSAGRYTVSWDGANANRERVASGVYLVRMEASPSTGSGSTGSGAAGAGSTSLPNQSGQARQRFVAITKAVLAK